MRRSSVRLSTRQRQQMSDAWPVLGGRDIDIERGGCNGGRPDEFRLLWATWVRETRVAAGLHKSTLAHRSGVDQSYIKALIRLERERACHE